MTSAVLFDLDGTFADTAPDLAAALNHVRGLHNLLPLPLEIIRPQASNGSAGLLKLGFGIEPDAAGFPAMREAFLAHYTDIRFHSVQQSPLIELNGVRPNN